MQVVNFLGFKVKIFILIQQILRTFHVPGTIENNTIFTLKELIAQLEHIFLSSSAQRADTAYYIFSTVFDICFFIKMLHLVCYNFKCSPTSIWLLCSQNFFQLNLSILHYFLPCQNSLSYCGLNIYLPKSISQFS